MAMSVRYTTVDGQVLCENRGGVKTLFMPDTLGNVIETRNMDTGAQTSSTTYWPYGEVRTQTGTNPSPFGFCGVWGYYTQAGQPTYVRARYYRPNLGRWQTVDPLWPGEVPYQYQSATLTPDPTGLKPGCGAQRANYIGCPPAVERYFRKLCNLICNIDDDKRKRINRCIWELSSRSGAPCKAITPEVLIEMKRVCQYGNVWCGPIGEGISGWAAIETDIVLVDHTGAGSTVYADRCRSIIVDNHNLRNSALIFIHEIGHFAGIWHDHFMPEGTRPKINQCNDIFSYCVYKNLW